MTSKLDKVSFPKSLICKMSTCLNGRSTTWTAASTMIFDSFLTNFIQYLQVLRAKGKSTQWRACFCHRSTVWVGSSVVRVLAGYARGPGLSPGQAMAFYSPVTFQINRVGKTGYQDCTLLQRKCAATHTLIRDCSDVNMPFIFRLATLI